VFFWDKAKGFQNEEMATAVEDRRHGKVVHFAKA